MLSVSKANEGIATVLLPNGPSDTEESVLPGPAKKCQCTQARHWHSSKDPELILSPMLPLVSDKMLLACARRADEPSGSIYLAGAAGLQSNGSSDPAYAVCHI